VGAWIAVLFSETKIDDVNDRLLFEAANEKAVMKTKTVLVCVATTKISPKNPALTDDHKLRTCPVLNPDE